MQNGGGFGGHTTHRTLVKGCHPDAFKGAQEAHFTAAPNACWVLLGRPQRELGMFQKSRAPRLGKSQQSFQQKADEPGPNEALLPLPWLQIGEA